MYFVLESKKYTHLCSQHVKSHTKVPSNCTNKEQLSLVEITETANLMTHR